MQSDNQEADGDRDCRGLELELLHGEHRWPEQPHSCIPLTATATDLTEVTLSQHIIVITVVSSTAPLVLLLDANSTGGLAPVIVSFSLSRLVAMSEVSLGAKEDGSVDFHGPP